MPHSRLADKLKVMPGLCDFRCCTFAVASCCLPDLTPESVGGSGGARRYPLICHWQRPWLEQHPELSVTVCRNWVRAWMEAPVACICWPWSKPGAASPGTCSDSSSHSKYSPVGGPVSVDITTKHKGWCIPMPIPRVAEAGNGRCYLSAMRPRNW